MVNTGGFKANNDFKSSYLQHLEQALKESLPNAEWQVVYDMITGNNTSGFAYDSVNRCGTVESPEVWDSYVKVYLIYIFDLFLFLFKIIICCCINKSLPHYDDLCIIFGKYRAQGNRVEDCEDMSHNENVEEELLQMEDDFNEQSEEILPTTNSCRVTWQRSSEASNTMSQSLNAELELQKKTFMVTSKILKIPSMDQRDKFKAS
uniref:Uncharacterized protein n=1 Tax=Lactuca sativa TaxID=4236 RepID=A0A9R1XNX1_LACSA|nr:hypothetical protein LSAT_V11C300120550 [Lactuca sativa]